MLLVRAGLRSATPGRWYLPGGGIEAGETPAACAVRETQEETGLSIRLGALLMTSPEAAGTIRHVFEGFVESGDLRHEVEGTSDLAQWHAIPPAGIDVMPFVLDAIEARQ